MTTFTNCNTTTTAYESIHFSSFLMIFFFLNIKILGNQTNENPLRVLRYRELNINEALNIKTNTSSTIFLAKKNYQQEKRNEGRQKTEQLSHLAKYVNYSV